MIWCITGITLFVLAFVFNKFDDTYNVKTDAFEILFINSFFLSLIIIAVSSICFVAGHSYVGKSEIQKAKDQHYAYVTLLEENKDITVQNQLYKDIVEYNTTLRKKKHYNSSPWTNWFYPDEWDELEYIEIK
jgi:hypothetical protein